MKVGLLIRVTIYRNVQHLILISRCIIIILFIIYYRT